MAIHNFVSSTGFGTDSGRQQRIECFVEVNVGDITSGEDYAWAWLPQGAADAKIDIVPIVVFNSATSDVLDVGNTSSENAYKNDFSIAALTAGSATGLPTTSPGLWLTFRWVGAGAAPTTGQFRLFLSYIMEGRAQFDHGESIYRG